MTKKSEILKGSKEITSLGKKSLKELSRLAFDDEVPLKNRCEILKWLTELSLGKGNKTEEVKDKNFNINVRVEK